MSSELKSAKYAEALKKVESDLSEIQQKLRALTKELDELDIERQGLEAIRMQYRKLLDGEKKTVTALDKTKGIQWKTNAYTIFLNDPERTFTSAQLFQLIYPKSENVSKDFRRKALINLSAALNKLVKEGRIYCENHPSNKGYIYFLKGNDKFDVQLSQTQKPMFGINQ